MIVDINKKSGFCAGVRNALDKVDEIIAKNPNKAIFFLEDIVHNENVISKYKKLGLKKISSNELNKLDKDNSIIILSAHGSSNKLKDKLKGFTLVDTSCPFVKRNQEIANSSRNLIYIGLKNHAESIATYEDINNYQIIETINDVDNLVINNDDYTVINQTTYNQYELEKIHNKIRDLYPNVKIINTLCNTTIINQNSVKDLSYDKVLIVGSRKSNNLNTLYEMTSIENKYIIETLEDLSDIDFNDSDKVLIVGCASTDPSYLELVKNEVYVKINN